MKIIAIMCIAVVLVGKTAIAQQFVPNPNFETYSCYDMLADLARVRAKSTDVTNSERVISSAHMANMSGYIIGYFQRLLEEQGQPPISEGQFEKISNYMSAECRKRPEKTLLEIARGQTLFKF